MLPAAQLCALSPGHCHTKGMVGTAEGLCRASPWVMGSFQLHLFHQPLRDARGVLWRRGLGFW